MQKPVEIEPRQRLLLAGSWHHVSCRCEARHIRQWSFAALVTLMGGRVCVCVCVCVCVWLALLAGLAAVCARYSDVSECGLHQGVSTCLWQCVRGSAILAVFSSV